MNKASKINVILMNPLLAPPEEALGPEDWSPAAPPAAEDAAPARVSTAPLPAEAPARAPAGPPARPPAAAPIAIPATFAVNIAGANAIIIATPIRAEVDSPSAICGIFMQPIT